MAVEIKKTVVKTVTEPRVVVFDGSVLHKKASLEDKASKKRFLVSTYILCCSVPCFKTSY